MAKIIYDLGNNENQALLFSWELPTSGNLPSINFYYSGFINPSLQIDNSQVDKNGITKNSTVVDIPSNTKPGTYSIDRMYLYDKYGPVKELTTKSEVSEYLKLLGISYDDFTIEVIGSSPPKVDNEAPKIVSAELKSKQINLSNGDTQIQLNSRIIDYSGLQYMQAGYNIVDANGNVDYSSSASTYLFPFDLGFSTPEVEKNYPSIINLSKPKAGKYELQSISLNDKAGNSISKNGKTDITAYLASIGIKYSNLSFEAIGEPPTHKDVNPPTLLSATLSSQTIDRIKGENDVLLNLNINDETKLNSASFWFSKIDSNGVIDIDSSFHSYTNTSDAGNTKDNYLSLVSTDSRSKNGLYVPSNIELTDILGNTKSIKNKDSVNDYLMTIGIDPATLTFNVIGDQPIQDVKINTIDLAVYTPTKPVIKEFKSGEPISIEIDYSDTSGLNKNDLGYIQINGETIIINYSDIIKGDVFNGTVRASFVIPNGANATEYYLNNILLRDASRNELNLGYNGYESNPETARSIFASKLGVSVNDLGFKLLKPNNAIVDSSAPTVNAIRFSAKEIVSTASGNQLIVEIDVTDASGVGSAFTLDSINLKDYSIGALSFEQIISIDGNLEYKNYPFDLTTADIIKGDKNNCTLRVIIDFPNSMDSSEWELTNLSLRDKAGNISNVYLSSSGGGNKINYGQHTEVERDVFADTLGVKKEDLRFRFINSNQNTVDNEKPSIKDIRFSASQIELNGNDSEQTIEIDFEDATGLKFNADGSSDDYIADIAIAPVNGLGKVIYLDFYARDLIKGDLKAGTIRKTFTIPKSEVSGERYIISLGISDRALNDRYIGSSGWDGVSKAEQDLIAFKLDIPSNKLGFNISNKNTSIVDLNAPTVKAIRFTDQDLIPPTISTYTITPSATTINEGAALTTSVATTNVTSGTTLYYSLSGPRITAADFSAGALTGSGTVGTDGKFSISHTLANDMNTEGTETIVVKVFSDSNRLVEIGARKMVVVNDTSTDPSPTYTIIPSSAVLSEGSVLTTKIQTTNVLPGTTLYYVLSGTGIQRSDFVSSNLWGSGIVSGDGSFSFSCKLLEDLSTENAEILEITLMDGSPGAKQTKNIGNIAKITINDTSKNESSSAPDQLNDGILDLKSGENPKLVWNAKVKNIEDAILWNKNLNIEFTNLATKQKINAYPSQINLSENGNFSFGIDLSNASTGEWSISEFSLFTGRSNSSLLGFNKWSDAAIKNKAIDDLKIKFGIDLNSFKVINNIIDSLPPKIESYQLPSQLTDKILDHDAGEAKELVYEFLAVDPLTADSNSSGFGALSFALSRIDDLGKRNLNHNIYAFITNPSLKNIDDYYIKSSYNSNTGSIKIQIDTTDLMPGNYKLAGLSLYDITGNYISYWSNPDPLAYDGKLNSWISYGGANVALDPKEARISFSNITGIDPEAGIFDFEIKNSISSKIESDGKAPLIKYDLMPIQLEDGILDIDGGESAKIIYTGTLKDLRNDNTDGAGLQMLYISFREKISNRYKLFVLYGDATSNLNNNLNPGTYNPISGQFSFEYDFSWAGDGEWYVDTFNITDKQNNFVGYNQGFDQASTSYNKKAFFDATGIEIDSKYFNFITKNKTIDELLPTISITEPIKPFKSTYNLNTSSAISISGIANDTWSTGKGSGFSSFSLMYQNKDQNEPFEITISEEDLINGDLFTKTFDISKLGKGKWNLFNATIYDKAGNFSGLISDLLGGSGMALNSKIQFEAATGINIDKYDEFIVEGEIINDGTAKFDVIGTPQVGKALFVAKVADDPDGNGSLSYQWQSSTDGNTWSNIGSNAATYTLTAAEQAKQIRVQVSYTDAQYYKELVVVPAGTVSDSTVSAINDGAATYSILAGNGRTAAYIVGQRLLVESTAIDPDGPYYGDRKYQWQSSTDGNTWSNIGINNEFYTLTAAEQAKQIRVLVSYTDGEGFQENVTVAGGYVPIVKEPIISITGNFIQSSTLTANVQLDPDSQYINSTFTYTWYANKEIIAAQTTKTLVLTDDLVGKRISATAAYTNSAGQSASISTAEKQVQAGFINSKGIKVKADVRLENANLDGGFTTINATTNPNAKKAVDALKANKVELSPTMVNFTIALPSNPTKPVENQTSASIAIGIDLVSDGIALSTGTGATSKPTPLSYYSVDSAGVASPFTYDPVSKTGANFYDTNSDGTPDLVTLAFVDGGRGDKDGIKNGKIVDPSTAATVNVSAVLANFKDSLLIADPLSDSPAALIVKAKLTSRAATVNEIGYVVLDKGETIDSIGFAGLKSRAQILFAGLESSDIPNLSSFSFDKSIALINGQSIRFFETTDSSFKELAADKSSVAGLGSSFKFLSTTIDSSTTKATAASSSGINFSLEIAGSFAGLDSLIGVNQADLPILDFSALAGIEVTADLSLAREASYNSSIGFYKILAIDGSVRDPISGNVFLPGDSGYKNAALSNKVTNLKDLSIGNLQNTTNEIKINESGMLAPYAIVSGADTYFAYAAANADLISHFKVLGTNIIGLEDLSGGGDKDFDDVVIGIKPKTLSAI